MKPVPVAVTLFSVIAVVHLLRLLLGWEVVINGYTMSLSLSVVAIVLAGGMAVWLHKST